MNKNTTYFDALPMFSDRKPSLNDYQLPLRRDFRWLDKDYRLTIVPGFLEDEQGETHLVFPGPDEKLVVSLLRRLAASEDFCSGGNSPWIRFSAENLMAGRIEADGDPFDLDRSIKIIGTAGFRINGDGDETEFSILPQVRRKVDTNRQTSIYTVNPTPYFFTDAGDDLLDWHTFRMPDGFQEQTAHI